MKKILLLVLLSITLTGCTGGIPTNLKAPTTVQPQGKVILGNQDYPMFINKYDWKDGKSESRKLGGPDIYELADTFETLEVKKSSKLKFEIEQNPTSVIIKQINEDDTVNEIQLEDNVIPLPAEDGYYIYEVLATWNEGEISYIFDINIK